MCAALRPQPALRILPSWLQMLRYPFVSGHFSSTSPPLKPITKTATLSRHIISLTVPVEFELLLASCMQFVPSDCTYQQPLLHLPMHGSHIQHCSLVEVDRQCL